MAACSGVIRHLFVASSRTFVRIKPLSPLVVSSSPFSSQVPNSTGYFKSPLISHRKLSTCHVTIPFQNVLIVQHRHIVTLKTTNNAKEGIQQSISALQAKKRPQRKKIQEDEKEKDGWLVVAYSTSEEFDLENLSSSLIKQGLYHPSTMPENMHDVLHVSAKYQVDAEPRELYLFREGSVVFWNVPEIERLEILKFLRSFETNSYDESLVQAESEEMKYVYTDNKTRLVNGKIFLNSEGSTDLEKYTFSNAMALSVKLALWEASLDQYVDSIEWITEDMKSGKKIQMTRDQVFRKTGELYALRHLINLSSDLLDTPDFYWDRQHLENLYQKTINHLNITKRTKVMNEKLNHCCELMELLSDHLNDRHHVRLEWMIIILIMVEVVFEIVHYLERFMGEYEGKEVVSNEE